MEDLRPSRAKRLIVGGTATLLVLGILAFVAVLMFSEPSSPVCDHIREVKKTDPRDADKMVDALESYVLGNFRRTNLSGTKQQYTTVEGTTPDERCHSAMKQINDVMSGSELHDLVDCMTHVKTSTQARSLCLKLD